VHPRLWAGQQAFHEAISHQKKKNQPCIRLVAYIDWDLLHTRTKSLIACLCVFETLQRSMGLNAARKFNDYVANA
jgi:hypothetical protein